EREGDTVTRSRSRTTQSSSSAAETRSQSRSRSRSSGGSRSVVPITKHEEFLEETGRQFYSLDEEWEQHVSRVHGLGKREAFIRVYNRRPVQIITSEIEEEKKDQRWERYRTQVLQRCRYVKPVKIVISEIETRRKELAALVEKTEDRACRDIKTFRE